jgi:hypothetical protein
MEQQQTSQQNAQTSRQNAQISQQNVQISPQNAQIIRQNAQIIQQKAQTIRQTGQALKTEEQKKNNIPLTDAKPEETKALVFDTGPIISLTTSNLLWLLDYLKTNFRGKFYITPAVRRELVDHPIETKKFKFEALQVQYRISKGVIDIASTQELNQLAEQLYVFANHSFVCKGHHIKIVSIAEMETIAWAIITGAQAAVVDERTTRLLVEEPESLKKILIGNLSCEVEIDQQNVNRFLDLTKGIRIIRSIELVLVAYERHMLDRYLLHTPNDHKILLESILWNVKLHGCSVSREEIDRIVAVELSRGQSEKEISTEHHH